jgi:hypothetical protein
MCGLITEIEAFHCLLGSELGVLRNGARILLQSLMLAILSHLVATDTFLPYPNPMARCLISSYRLGSLRLLYQLPPPNPRPQGPVGHCPRPRLSVLLYQLIGYTPKKSFLLTMLNNCFQFLANILSLFLVTTVDRRLLTVWGQFVCGAALFFFGGTSLPGTYSGYLTTVCVMLVWGFVYQLTLGTVAWTLIAELASYRLRARTQWLANATLCLIQWTTGFVFPYMFNPDQGNLQGKVGFVFGATTFIGFAGTFFFLPETKNRTALELHELFERRVPTWGF